MSRYVLIVKGSPRKNGNSAILADQVAAGAIAAGAEVETIFLHGMDIEPCRACDSCQKALETNCVIQDDMQALYPKLRRLDALVIASPVYWFTVSAQTKLFMDRGLYPLNGPEGHALANKLLAAVLTYGDTDPFTSGAVNALRTFQDAAHFMRAKIAGFVYASAGAAGEVRQQSAVLERAFALGQYLAKEA